MSEMARVMVEALRCGRGNTEAAVLSTSSMMRYGRGAAVCYSRRAGSMSAEEEAAAAAAAEPTAGGVAMAVGAMGAGAIGAVGLSILGVAGALYGASFAAATFGMSTRIFEE